MCRCNRCLSDDIVAAEMRDSPVILLVVLVAFAIVGIGFYFFK